MSENFQSFVSRSVRVLCQYFGVDPEIGNMAVYRRFHPVGRESPIPIREYEIPGIGNVDRMTVYVWLDLCWRCGIAEPTGWACENILPGMILSKISRYESKTSGDAVRENRKSKTSSSIPRNLWNEAGSMQGIATGLLFGAERKSFIGCPVSVSEPRKGWQMNPDKNRFNQEAILSGLGIRRSGTGPEYRRFVVANPFSGDQEFWCFGTSSDIRDMVQAVRENQAAEQVDQVRFVAFRHGSERGPTHDGDEIGFRHVDLGVDVPRIEFSRGRRSVLHLNPDFGVFAVATSQAVFQYIRLEYGATTEMSGVAGMNEAKSVLRHGLDWHVDAPRIVDENRDMFTKQEWSVIYHVFHCKDPQCGNSPRSVLDHMREQGQRAPGTSQFMETWRSAQQKIMMIAPE